MPRAGKRCSYYHNWGRRPPNTTSSVGIPRNDSLMASFGHTFGHTLCRDATLGHSPTIPRIKVAPHIGRGVVARLDRSINPVVVRFCFRKWMPRRATLCPFDLTRDGARSTKLQIPIGVSSQFVAPSFDYGCCSQLEYFMASLFALFVWEKTLDRRKFERSREKRNSKWNKCALIFGAFFFSSK